MIKGLEKLVHHCGACNRTTDQSLVVALDVNAAFGIKEKTNVLEATYKCNSCNELNRYIIKDAMELLKEANRPKITSGY